MIAEVAKNFNLFRLAPSNQSAVFFLDHDTQEVVGFASLFQMTGEIAGHAQADHRHQTVEIDFGSHRQQTL